MSQNFHTCKASEKQSHILSSNFALKLLHVVQLPSKDITLHLQYVLFKVGHLFNINRDNAKRLVYENDMLQMQMSNTEKDTLDVISFLKQEDGKKDEQVYIFSEIRNYIHLFLYQYLFCYNCV